MDYTFPTPSHHSLTNPPSGRTIGATSLRTNLVRLRKQPRGYVFKQPELLAWVTANRALLLSAIFAILKDWINRGSPTARSVWNGHFRSFWSVVDAIIPYYFALPSPTQGLKAAVNTTASPVTVLLRSVGLMLKAGGELGKCMAATELLRTAGENGIPWNGREIPVDDDEKLQRVAGVFARMAKPLFDESGDLEVDEFAIRRSVFKVTRPDGKGTADQIRYVISLSSHQTRQMTTNIKEKPYSPGDFTLSGGLVGAFVDRVTDPTQSGSAELSSSVKESPVLDLY